MVSRTSDWRGGLDVGSSRFWIGRYKSAATNVPPLRVGNDGPGDRKSVQTMSERVALVIPINCTTFIAAGVWMRAGGNGTLVHTDKRWAAAMRDGGSTTPRYPRKARIRVVVAAQYAVSAWQGRELPDPGALTWRRGEKYQFMLALRLSSRELDEQSGPVGSKRVSREYRTARTKPELAWWRVDRAIGGRCVAVGEY